MGGGVERKPALTRERLKMSWHLQPLSLATEEGAILGARAAAEPLR